MNIVIVLGNRINDDGSLSAIMQKRLKLTLEYYQNFKPDHIIVSGGLANEAAGITEAKAMKEYLVSHGIKDEVIILEDNSHTTVENAKFSVPIAKSFNPDLITVITTCDHHHKNYYSVADIFNSAINDEKIRALYYTDTNL